MKGREMLKTILSKSETARSGCSSSETELSLDESPESKWFNMFNYIIIQQKFDTNFIE